MIVRYILALSLTCLAMLAPRASAQLIVAHRGASADAPENTLAAFTLAWEQGCDGIEGDFYLTADQQIVCIHDKTTERTTGVDRAVEESTLDQLRRLDAGSWKGSTWAGERIPTFEEVFHSVPEGRLFVIELKSKSPIVPVLANELRRLDSGKINLLVISFDAATIHACKQQLPGVRAHWLTKFERTTPSSRYRPTAAEVVRTVKSCGADGVGFKGMIDVVNDAFVQSLRADGCSQYHVWTIDSEQDAKYFQTLGVYGITTNRPAVIATAIAPQVLPN